MKTIHKSVLIAVSFTCLLLTTQCDRFEPIDFITGSVYMLDSRAHEFEVVSKQRVGITVIYIDGEMGTVHLGYVFEKDTVINYGTHTVKYEKGEAVEIMGRWFNVKKKPSASESTHIFIDENKEEIERNLIIKLSGFPYRGEIKITQKGRE